MGAEGAELVCPECGEYPAKAVFMRRSFSMIKITKKTQQIVLDDDERYVLRKELEDAFISLDTKTGYGQYSLEAIYKISPRLAEFYSLLGE